MRVAMPLVSPELKADYEHRLELARVPPAQRPGYHKWVRWYLYFCQKYGYAPNLPTSRGPFLNKLASTNPPMDQLIAAAAAIRLLPRPAGGPPETSSVQAGNTAPAPAVASLPGRGASWEHEYRELEAAICMRNYSRKTLAAYRWWIAKFQGFVHSRPTAELGTQEVRGFLSELAVRHAVAASTQNQAFNALLFFYRHVLGRELPARP
jgi:hypothetical protein